MRRLLAVLAVTSTSALACSAPQPVANVPSLDSPNGMAVACIGLHRDTATADPVPVSLPSSACGDLTPYVPDAGLPDAEPPPDAIDGDADVPDAAPPADVRVPPWESPVQYALITEQARGDVMIAHVTTASLIDTDLLSPGLNGLPVGQLPVGIALTADGCYAVTANAGSCDLAAINVLSATLAERDAVTRLTVSSPTEILAARPSAIIGPKSVRPPVGFATCDPSPNGEVYVAYPACRVVAHVSVATGRILDAVQFSDTAPPAVVSADAVTCAAECNDVPPTGRDAGVDDVVDAGPSVVDAAPSTDPDAAPAGATPGMPDPSALALEPDGSRLYIGTYGSPVLTIAELDASGGFAAVSTVTLEGAIGILRLAASGPQVMGNEDGGPSFSFVYAIGRDGAIHVVDVTPTRPARECDAQVDRRYLRNETDVARMACMPVGDPATPPRRVNVQGPGIRLPIGRVPLDVIFVRGNATLEPGVIENPSALNGLFALVTTLGSALVPPRGQAHYITVDDDNYPDFEDPADPRLVDMQLAVPHTLRDRTDLRRNTPQGCDGEPPPAVSENTPVGPPRIDEQGTDTRRINFQDGYFYNWRDLEGSRFAPSIHVEQCDSDDIIWELQANKPMISEGTTPVIDHERDLHLALLREELFPDLGNLSNEEFVVAWEGPLEPDPFLSRRPGGDVAPTSPDTLKVTDTSGTFCELGVEKGDMVRLLGCNLDADCGPHEICAVHPEAPVGTSGMCLPEEQRDVLLGRCAGLLTSFRKYTVQYPFADWLELLPRPAVMDGSPADGCSSAAQCDAIYRGMSDDRTAQDPNVVIPDLAFACEPDPYGGMGLLPRCIPACQSNDECGDGTVCDTDIGRCILGPLPLPECVSTLQFYEVRAGDAFTMVGDVTGYHHRVVAAPDGACVVDESKSPLLTSRFHRVEPPCASLDPDAIFPNPCIMAGAEEPVFAEEDTNGDGVTEVVIRTRPTRTVRIRTPGLVLDVADVAIPVPYADAAIGPNVWYSPITSTYAFAFPTAGGFVPQIPAPMQAHFPKFLFGGPEGLTWVIDSGEGIGQNGRTRGQVIGLAGGANGYIWIF